MKKSIDYHAANITQITAELTRLPDCHPEYEKTQEKLSRQLSAWAGKLSITIQVANNEKLPWLTEELGYPCIPMSLKEESMTRQVGDYIAYLDDYDMFAGILVERKTLQDIYSTLMNRDSRSRLYREIARAESDPRFNRFHLIAECTYEEFLQYVPSIFVFTQDSASATLNKNIIQYFKRFYKIDVLPYQIKIMYGGRNIYINTDNHQIHIDLVSGGAEVFIGGVLRETLVPKKNEYGKIQYFIRRGATEVSKIETINSLENRIQVSFVGSRERAVEKYSGLVRKWCVRNYKDIIGIEV